MRAKAEAKAFRSEVSWEWAITRTGSYWAPSFRSPLVRHHASDYRLESFACSVSLMHSRSEGFYVGSCVTW